MKIENTCVFGFESAIRGMRNPMNSWARSDSAFGGGGAAKLPCPIPWTRGGDIYVPEIPFVGPEDLKLARKLIRGGSEHRKFLRQIEIWVDITIPRYVWQELDTYKVATVRNSCSTMHKLGHTDLERSDFQDDEIFPEVLERLNLAGRAYRMKESFDVGRYGYHDPDAAAHETLVLEGHEIVRWMKKHVPEGFLQRATYSFSYETAISILRQRGKHRLPEWSGVGGICEWLRSLPYLREFEEALV